MRTSLIVAGTLALALMPASGQTIAAPARPTPHVGAAHSMPNGEVCFELPRGVVDWRTVAVDALGERVVRQPEDTLLRSHFRDPTRTSSLPFEAPASRSIVSADWLLLTEDGILPVHPRLFRGTVEYSLDPRTYKVVAGPVFNGEACTRSARDSTRAAFVLSGEAPTAWTRELGPTASVT